MFDFKDLKSAKSKTEDRDNKRESEADRAYNEALALIREVRVSSRFDAEKLRKAADKLVVSLTNKRNKAEAYLCLAQIFFIINDIPASVQYLKVARAINPSLNGIEKLQSLISSV